MGGSGEWLETRERIFVWLHVLTILGVPRVPAVLEAPAHRDRRRSTSGSGGRGRAAGSSRSTSRSRTRLRYGSARGRSTDMTWKQMLDTMSCTECGRCQDVCPAWATGKALSPKLLIMGLRDRLFEEGPSSSPAERRAALVPGRVTDDVVWDCVTCGACVHECPVSIEHVDHIVDLRRHLVMVESRFPSEAGTMLRDVGRSPNPWGEAAGRARARGPTASTCASSSRATRRPRSSTGSAAPPRSTSAPARRPARPRRCSCARGSTSRSSARASRARETRRGGWGTSTRSRRRRSRTSRRSGRPASTRIVTSCPHCFNTLGNEYADFGGRYEVVHHTELLAELLRDGRLEAPAGTDGDHVPRLVLPRPSQRRRRGAARDRLADRQAARDGAERQANVLLRCRRRAHVDGGARGGDQRGAGRARRRRRAPRPWRSPAPSAR